MLTKLHDDLVTLARQNVKEAARLAGANPPAGVTVEESAAWVALARAMMNLDEFVTRE